MPLRKSARIAAKASKAEAAVEANISTAASGKRKSQIQRTAPQKKSTGVKRKATKAQTMHTAPTKRIKKEKHIDTNAPLGVIDPLSKIKGAIVSLDGEPCDVMLVLVNPTKQMDEFYVIQLIKRTNGSHVVYTRWGKTGTKGKALARDFALLGNAIDCFMDTFEDKTGLSWETCTGPAVDGKYRMVQQNFDEKSNGYSTGKWQYWVDDGVDGKQRGWYDYAKEGSIQVEQLFHEHSRNPHLHSRVVASGVWTYNVDLTRMIQTNVTHPNHTSRRIRRCIEGFAHANTPPVASRAIVTPPPTLPHRRMDIASIDTASSTVTTKKGSHPVDVDIGDYYPSTPASSFSVVQGGDGIWYDAVLNQCNIIGGSNNNKYYRIQLLRRNAGSNYYVWNKWGRVGESSTGRILKGPFGGEAAALADYAKKYRDKTGNAYDAECFVPKTRKYIPLEIDNDVVVDSTKMEGLSDAKTQIEYLPSELDAKTQDLVEVLFSKETRNKALTSFNIDLKRLPLGVPSERQIEVGIGILNNIEDKLNGGSVRATYSELSSQFYTSIPHSFGRWRPPAIDSQDKLQSRYDMCNILLDIHSTNETMRNIDKKRNTVKTEVPNPTDSYYKSMKTDLKVMDKKSEEYKMIQKYFDKTKGSHSSAKLLDIWAVDRSGEEERFEKYNAIDNRRLLWHGTNIAVVAPILTSGLRIMPHSGGRVGAGIYLASMQQKSAQYTNHYGAKFGCMFLTEAVLGKPHQVTSDGPHASGLRKAPAGFDSVHAVGTTQPKTWKSMTIDGKVVQVPQDQGVPTDVTSSFGHDEYLVYEEAQVRIRYVVTVKMH